ncbi:AfsR/SARP family transcriptional regulator [Nonomuraea soli]|uniref:DNA-binding SARP family transcriptional activator n=1 Tax=Nonomuraea soli TaxID=1032476 RepID=A0A7W0CH26_9ACTN|nr:winged helix-turn-helix domain-containing protein [Nonomuraea soli]MBA2891036.1 DNA-binding SARP family transcriptional activator [Nonomuraea soli]
MTLFVRCFADFTIEVDGVPVELSPVRRRARTLLRLLAMHAGRPVHRESVVDALWPQERAATARRGLHVAVSSLRGYLTAHAGHPLVDRVGEAYRLVLPEGGGCDVALFRAAIKAGHHRVAVELYGGDLLPQDGPAEWVVQERSMLRHQAATAAVRLAAAELERGEPAAAVEAATRGLELDRYHDGAWRLLIEGNRRRGDQLGLAAARRRYERALASLEGS